MADQDMSSIMTISSHRYANDDKFFFTMLFEDNVVIKKIIFLKNIPDTVPEEDSGFKPPLFLVGIGLAILYQVQSSHAGIHEARPPKRRGAYQHAIERQKEERDRQTGRRHVQVRQAIQ